MNDRISYVCALSMIAVGCATEAQVTCEVFVDAWADYDVRCPVLLAPPVEGTPTATEADRERVEELFFGDEGCAGAELEDFRDARALRDECAPALSELSCSPGVLPDACQDQIRTPR
jgi:hypothetical protein